MNRLGNESSPYLLQHKNNPVHWQPWGSEALEQARSENKPILLSIGYSACHWCHVMEHESFENEAIAQLMNDHFVSIKVDREERPDLDQIYQNVAQALTRSGGWPLTVFLTPDLRPFFGGTYFPPDDRFGRPGFSRVLTALANAYQNDRASILMNALKLTEVIGSLQSISVEGERLKPSSNSLIQAVAVLLEHVDSENGGMGGAPKFPNCMTFTFLWRAGLAFQNIEAQAATLLTLIRMAKGGIYDQLGGGFHRYSVDEKWNIPHFEKMLYDNALLLKLYAEVLLTGQSESQIQGDLFLTVLEETTEYVLREMLSPEGGFFTAQDADSEGEEGKFFAWDSEELKEYLSPEELSVFVAFYGVTDQGNFEHGKTVLQVVSSGEELEKAMGLSLEQVGVLMSSARQKLLAIRGRRIAPGLDHKILVAWNGLMISGLVWAAQAFRLKNRHAIAEKAQNAAEKAFDFISTKLNKPSESNGRGNATDAAGDQLMGSYCAYAQGTPGGRAKGPAFLDDYAFMAMAALDLSRFSEPSESASPYLQKCEGWIEVILKHFKDPDGVSYYFTSDDHERLIQRPKMIHDQAIPSGAAVALTCMAALGEMGISPRSEVYLQEVDSQMAALFQSAQKNPHGHGELLCASLLQLVGPMIVSGREAFQLARNPHVFQKPTTVGQAQKVEGLLVCHRKACSPPYEDLSRAMEDVRAGLKMI